jgi:hypothetical protein
VRWIYRRRLGEQLPRKPRHHADSHHEIVFGVDGDELSDFERLLGGTALVMLVLFLEMTPGNRIALQGDTAPQNRSTYSGVNGGNGNHHVCHKKI